METSMNTPSECGMPATVVGRTRFASFLLTIAISTTFLGACRQTALTRAEEPRSSYSATVSEGAAVVKASVLTLLQNTSLMRDTPFAPFRAHVAGDPVFPSVHQLEFSSGGAQDVAAYLSTPPVERIDDLYLFDPVGRFWNSEYEANGAPLPFHCNFLVHLGSRGSTQTEISVLEHAPTVNAGRRFFLLGHEGPGFYDDLRVVPPTNRERDALLRLILTQLKASAAR
jgi:hypothetical protein